MPTPRTQRHRAATPWGELVLEVRREEPLQAALILEGTFLMDSALAISEQALAARGVAALRARRTVARPPAAGWRVLVGGLGLGLTLQTLLAARDVGPVDVVEIFTPVIDWNRTLLTPLNGGAVADARVHCHPGDLRGFLEARGTAAQPPYDLVLLDVDNGPTWLSRPENAWFYEPEGLERLRCCTGQGGVIAIWATERSVRFERRLAAIGWGTWRAETVTTTHGGRNLDYTLYLIERSPEASTGERDGGPGAA